MKSNEDICAVLYLKDYSFIGPISFWAGAILEWFIEQALLGRDWLLVGAMENLCFCNYINVLIINMEVIIDCVELFREHWRVTLSKLS